MINRAISSYLTKIAKTFSVVVVTGPWQSGKTTLVQNQFPTHGYVNLEDPDTRLAAETDGAGFFHDHPPPLIIDEIQRLPTLLSYIQVWVDEHRSQKGQFILTGSHRPLLKAGVANRLPAAPRS